MLVIDWLVRAGDGENLKNSYKYQIWGSRSSDSNCKKFMKNVKPGDRLWFVQGERTNGKLLAVATYCSHNKREFGPLINVSLTDEELGWYKSKENDYWDVEIHYADLYILSESKLLSNIKGPSIIREYNEKCKVNLPVEYSKIVRDYKAYDMFVK